MSFKQLSFFEGQNNLDESCAIGRNIQFKLNALFNFKVCNFSKYVVTMPIKKSSTQTHENMVNRLLSKSLKHNTQRPQI